MIFIKKRIKSQCKNYECVSKQTICDGEKNCLDGSDENCHNFNSKII